MSSEMYQPLLSTCSFIPAFSHSASYTSTAGLAFPTSSQLNTFHFFPTPTLSNNFLAFKTDPSVETMGRKFNLKSRRSLVTEDNPIS